MGFIGKISYNAKLANNFESEHMDLTLKLSPCDQEAEEKWVTKNYEEEKAESSVVCMDMDRCVEGENKCLVRFGDLQTMRRVRTGKRLLLEKQRRAAEASKLNSLPNPSPSSHHTHQGEGEASSNIKITLKPSSDDTKLQSPAKKLKHMNPYLKKGDAMNILRKMPSVTTSPPLEMAPKGRELKDFFTSTREVKSLLCVSAMAPSLSPTEFVMHAGGNKVADPMKHITLSSDSFYIHGDYLDVSLSPFRMRFP